MGYTVYSIHRFWGDKGSSGLTQLLFGNNKGWCKNNVDYMYVHIYIYILDEQKGRMISSLTGKLGVGVVKLGFQPKTSGT